MTRSPQIFAVAGFPAGSVNRCVRRILALMLIMSLGGCATDTERTQGQGVGAGALIGAGLGALLGGKNGAIAGGAIGAALGGAYGNKVAQKKTVYAQQEDQLRLIAAQANQTAQRAREYNAQLQLDIAALDQERGRLHEAALAADARRQMAMANQQRVQELLTRTNDQIAGVRQEIARQREAISTAQQQATAQQQTPSETGIRLVSYGVRDLDMQRRALERAQAQLALIDQRRDY